LKNLENAMSEEKKDDILPNLTTLAKLSFDENRINSLFLIKHNFLPMVQQLFKVKELRWIEQIFLILDHMAEEKEFY
jgi:hypothetical protein